MKQLPTQTGFDPWEQSPVTVSPLTLADLREVIWQEAADWQCCGGVATQSAASVSATAEKLAAPLPLTLSSLLALDGAAFITAAYQTLLGRPPDPTGFKQAVVELERGRSKVEILQGMQISVEARSRGERLPGLQLRYLAQTLRQRPNSLLRFGRRVLRGRQPRLPPSVTPLPHPPAVSPPAKAIDDGTNARAEQLEQRLAEHTAALQLLNARLASLQAAHDAATQQTSANAAKQGADLAAATSSLSDELVVVARRVTMLERDSKAALRSEPARLS